MDILSKYLPCKVLHITSSLYSSILLWTVKLPFPLKNNSKQHSPAINKGDLKVGLKTLIHSKEKLPSRVVHCYNMTPTSKPCSLQPPPPPPQRSSSLWSTSPYAFQPTVMGDVIGTESGDCMMSEVVDYAKPTMTRSMVSRPREKSSARTRQFPPPITLLRETGRMPLVFKRECNDDGRLIVRIVQEEHYTVYCEKCGYPMNEEEEKEDLEDLEFNEERYTVYCEECGYPMNEEEEKEDLEDLEFNEEPEGLECDKEEEEEEEEVGFEFEEELAAKEGSNLSEKCSLEKETGDLRKSVTYSGGLFLQDSDSFWKDANGYLGRPGSAPLLRPMTPVM